MIIRQNGSAPAVFLITEEDILDEELLEHITNFLLSYQIPSFPDSSEDGISSESISNCLRSNFHTLICLDPKEPQFRNRCWKFPALLNRCTMNWIMEWPATAFHTTAISFIKDVGENENHNNALARVCVSIHESVVKMYQRVYTETSRRIHLGLHNFIDLLELYRTHLKRRSELLVSKRTRIANGLNKVLSTNEMVFVMQDELRDLTPQIEIQLKEIERQIHRLANDTKIAEDFRIKVLNEEAEAKEKEIIMRAIADDAQCDLEVTTPSIKMAQDALKAINKNDLNELKAMTSPPPLVMFVLEAVCVLLGVKPAWDAAKKLLSEPNFPKRLMDFDKEQISDATMKKIKTYIEHKDFDPLVLYNILV